MGSIKCYFTKVDDITKSPKADRMLLATINNSQAWVGLDTNVGDTGLFFYPDAVLDETFQDAYTLRSWDETNQSYKSYLTNGRVKTQFLRKEWSDGLFVKMTNQELANLTGDYSGSFIDSPAEMPIEVPPHPAIYHELNEEDLDKGELPGFPVHFETEQFNMNIDRIVRQLNAGWTLSISHKKHGESGRAGYLQLPDRPTFLEKALLFVSNIHPVFKRYVEVAVQSSCSLRSYYQHVTGSRRTVAIGPSATGTARDILINQLFWLEHNEKSDLAIHKDEVVFFEVIGHDKLGKAVMPRYKGRAYDYGIKDGEADIEVYRITFQGVDLSPYNLAYRASLLGFKTPEVLYESEVYDTTWTTEKLQAIVDHCLRSIEALSATSRHTLEGIVIRIDHPNQTQRPRFYKLKTRQFCLEEGIG